MIDDFIILLTAEREGPTVRCSGLTVLSLLILTLVHALWAIVPDHPGEPVWIHEQEQYIVPLIMLALYLPGLWLLWQSNDANLLRRCRFNPVLDRYVGGALLVIYAGICIGMWAFTRPDGPLPVEAAALKALIIWLWTIAFVGGGIGCCILSWRDASRPSSGHW